MEPESEAQIETCPKCGAVLPTAVESCAECGSFRAEDRFSLSGFLWALLAFALGAWLLNILGLFCDA